MPVFTHRLGWHRCDENLRHPQPSRADLPSPRTSPSRIAPIHPQLRLQHLAVLSDQRRPLPSSAGRDSEYSAEPCLLTSTRPRPLPDDIVDEPVRPHHRAATTVAGSSGGTRADTRSQTGYWRRPHPPGPPIYGVPVPMENVAGRRWCRGAHAGFSRIYQLSN